MIRHIFISLGLVALISCTQAPPPIPQSGPKQAPAGPTAQANVNRVASVQVPRVARNNFIAVLNRIEPVAEDVCRKRASNLNCDFKIVVDPAQNAPPNAFQTVDERGRPIIAFTIPLIAQTRNQDELAFIMAHEAAHHIEGHLGQLQRNASVGAGLASVIFAGTDPEALRTAQQLGAAIGSRVYSKDFELEADALGTVITFAAGYDPLIGAQFFQRIPDPGNTFLGTHPANAERVTVVQRVAAGLQ